MDNFWEHLQNLTDAQSIISLGFYFLLIVVFAETGLFFGFFLPGDYLLFMSGLLCSSGRLSVSIVTLILSLIAAGILGNYTGYWFGYRTGPKLFSKNNFAVTRLEEWISHKVSSPGPREKEENRSRKEIPLFMCIEAKVID